MVLGSGVHSNWWVGCALILDEYGWLMPCIGRTLQRLNELSGMVLQIYLQFGGVFEKHDRLEDVLDLPLSCG